MRFGLVRAAMSQSFVEQDAPLGGSRGMGQALAGATTAEPPPLPVAGRYALSLLLVALATVLAFVMGTMVATPSLTLLYVLPVVIAAVTLGWGPSLAAAVAGVL